MSKYQGLYLVAGEEHCTQKSLEAVVVEAVRGGVKLVQLREKTASTREFIEKAARLKLLLEPFQVPLIINDRVDVALAIDAAGVHIGQSDMDYQTVRKLIGPEKIIGLSVETMDEVIEAQDWDVAYLGVSPIFSTPTKTDTKEPWGTDGLRKIKQFSKHPLVAIGGLNQTNINDVLEAGADGIAIVSAICASPTPKESAVLLSQIIEGFFSQIGYRR
ncbi:MAG: thiamine phosphate synthase [Chlorobiales bacterium]|nr:thiamine phosphate synthase [Chlorobiales bacterium]